MSSYITSILLMVCFIVCESHDPTTQGCKNPAGMPNFDKSQYEGKWNILRVDHGINNCISQEYFLQADGDFTVTQSRNLRIGNVKVPMVTGTLEENGPVASKMKIKWLLSGQVNDMSYTVLDTDYSSYALTYECEDIFRFGSIKFASESLAIMGRDITLDDATIQGLIELAKSLGLSTDTLKVVSHDNCA